MRALTLFLLAGISLTSLAELRPLTMKEVGLMLRAGYSSESILQEVSKRGVSEPLEDATRKTLMEFHASTELIATLEKGAALVSAEEAERARVAAAEEAERRRAEATRVDRDANAVLKERATREAASRQLPGTTLAESFRGKMVVCKEGTLSPANDTEFETKKLVALYFSAHWCGPCRKFTPQLVDFYRQMAPLHPEFEVVFVSLDKSRFNWQTYMRDMGMPWPAIDYDQTILRGNLGKFGGDSIPSLVLIDSTGRVLATSYEGDKYVGPTKVIATLNQMWSTTAAK
jgi:nucleoredoxin